MDTVNMLNTMRFYCQPILPLVYDESMSYYETLCKVVGQLNTTGETVNKLNEGLTNEIADRQAADVALDERLKKIEEQNKRIHFLVFEGASPMSVMPTRSELYNWVRDGDAIFTLFHTDEEGRGQIYAASCSYNAGNWGSEASNDFNIIVPLETTYDEDRDYAVKQKVAKLSIPLSPQTNLNSPWRLHIIEINTPSTSAEGVVNLVAAINDSDSVNCSLTPSEFLSLYNMTRGGKNLCVAVNAKLAYDGLARSSSVATVDTNNRKIRIAFERDYGVFTNNGVKQLNKTLDYIIGDATTNVWTHETIDSKTLDFIRYEGFQFTRGENNVITANDESTPNAVYAQYHSDTSGKLYQNLPVRLIDTVDNAEYWNGVFDIKDNKHMTFTFVTSNYVTASGKMTVRVIELSADVNTTTWKYSEKEFTLPLDVSSGVVTYTASNVGEGVYSATKHKTEYQVDFAEGVPAIIASIEAGKRVILMVDLNELGSELGSTPIYFASGYTRVDLLSNAISYIFSASIHNWRYTLELNSGLTHATLTDYGELLPVPNPDGTDNGKVPTVENNKWELKEPTGGGSSDFVITGSLTEAGGITLDKTFAQIQEAVQAGKNVLIRAYSGPTTITLPLTVKNSDISTEYDFSVGYFIEGRLNGVTVRVMESGPVLYTASTPTNNTDGTMPQVSMAAEPTEDMQIATKKYVDDHRVRVDAALSDTSTNPVQNKAVTAALSSAVREAIYPIAVTANSADWTVNNGIAYKEASADRTFDNIKAAYNANKTLVCTFEKMEYSLILASTTAFIFASYRGAVANDSQYSGLGKYPTSLITITTTGVGISRTAGDLPAVGGTDNGKMLIVAGGEWALQRVPGTTVDVELSTTSENPVQNKTVTDALNGKLPKTGGTVTGALRTNDSFSAGGTIAFGEAPIVMSQTDDGAAKILYGSADVNDNPPPLSRLKVARPTEDDDAATKKYVDDRNDSPQFKGYVTLTPANAPIGTGVGLSPTGSGNDFTLNISDVNEGTPTLLTGVKTPTDADTNAAATVEYVKAKAKKAATIDVAEEEVKSYNYADIDSEIINGGGNVWLSLGTNQMRMVAYDKTGASSYELTFVNFANNSFNIHTITVSPSAASYSYITK